MSVTSEKPAGAAAVRPFRVEIPQADVDELRRRVAATRWPDKDALELLAGSMGGVCALSLAAIDVLEGTMRDLR